MMYFDKKWFKVIRILRLIFYILFLGCFIFIPTKVFIDSGSVCPIANKFGLLCPTCGVTRAFSSIMHFKFIDAFNYNQVFTCAIAPISLCLIIDDSINIITSLITRKYKYSIVEYLIVGVLN